MSAPRNVLHVGPDPAVPGGIGSVMRVLQDAAPIPAAIAPSWTPGSRAARARAGTRALAAVARAPRSTVVHVHMAADGSAVRKAALLTVARRTGHVAVATIHGSRFEAFARERPRVARAALRRADALFVLSPGLLATAERLAPGVPASLVANPVEVDGSVTDAGARPPVVVFAGEVGERKGVDVLVAAWPAVRAAVPSAELHIVGPPGGWPVPAVDGVTLVGPLRRDQVRQRLRAARLVALPSRAEALPMTLLEGLASGTPFVATGVGDIPRLAATGGGVTVPVGDSPALAAALIAYLTDDRAATRAGQAGWAACAEQFGAEQVAAELVAAYPVRRRRRR